MIVLDIYDWILSPGIRDYIRENHVLSYEEKVKIICGGCRSIEEKYEVFNVLSKEAKTQEDKELIQSLLRLYDWAFEELRSERPGQVFIFMEYRSHSLDEVLNAKPGGVEQVCHTYTELQAYIKEYGILYRGQFRTANIEKWAMADGTMQQVMELHICADHGNAYIDRFDIPREQYGPMGICFAVQIANTGDYRTTIPLPFQNGDLVKIDIPLLDEPLYGVLQVSDALGRYMKLAYIGDHCLKKLEMSYQDIGTFSGWRVIDWTHPAQPSELPSGQEFLAELSQYMHRTGLNPEEKERLCNVFCCDDKLLFRTQITLADLLEEMAVGNRIVEVLEEENRWLTFDELFIKVQPDCDWTAFAAQLEQLVDQRHIQYVLPRGADVGCYGLCHLKPVDQNAR